MGKIILGSSSPRRFAILKELKLDFMTIPSGYVEDHTQTDFSYEFVESLAYNKALDIALKNRNKDYLIIGADTIVVHDNKILGKPSDYEDAKNMLNKLSGNTHFVVTAISVINSKNLKFHTQSTTTYVTFNSLTKEQIDNYIRDYNPYDKAGSYGIQELPQGFVKNVDGDIENVIGLSSKTLLNLLNEDYR